MFNWLAGPVRWLVVILALGGPALAYLTWQDINRIAAIKADGVGAQATLVGGTLRTSRRGTPSFDLDVAWTDATGGRRTARVAVSADYAHSLMQDGRFRVATIPIRYLPTNIGMMPLAVNDPHRQGDGDQGYLIACIVATFIGVFGWLALRWHGRRQPQ